MKAKRSWTTAVWGAMFCAVFGVAVSVAGAQETQLPPAAAVEKDLAAKASDVTEVTLDKSMLGFAANVMKDKDDAAAKQLIQGLQGIYVREYDFDKEGQYTQEQVDALRKHYETGEWSPMVHERETKTHESTDVLVKMVNGTSQGLFVFVVAPKEITMVLILGPIKMDDLGKLGGLGGLGALGSINGVQHAPHGKKGGTE